MDIKFSLIKLRLIIYMQFFTIFNFLFFFIFWAAFQLLCRLEGIFPSLEASHALAYLEKLCPTLPNGAKVVVNCSGRGDKDATTVLFNSKNVPTSYEAKLDGAIGG